jgi:hypothetical protein
VHRLEHDDIYPRQSSHACANSVFGATIARVAAGVSVRHYADIVERIARVWMSLTGILTRTRHVGDRAARRTVLKAAPAALL